MSRSSFARPLVAASFVVLSSSSARADDLFEIDVFHARVDQVGQLGLELHSNYVASSVAARDPPELSPNHVLYEMLEPSYGFSPGLEFGAHIQGAVRPDGSIEAGGLKVRIMGILPTPPSFPLLFAVNVEGGYIPRTYDPRTTVLEIRPIAELRTGALDIDVNPIISVGTRGDHPGVPTFEPCAAVRYRVLGTVDLGFEYYGSLAGTHYVFETIDLARWATWLVHAGVGEGLTASSDALIITTLVGRYF